MGMGRAATNGVLSTYIKSTKIENVATKAAIEAREARSRTKSVMMNSPYVLSMDLYCSIFVLM